MNDRARRKILGEVLLPPVFDHWREIRNACARSLRQRATGFLPPDPTMTTALGCGFWGCVFPTADKRFVIKVSIDATEGPYVAQAMKYFQKDPGLAYYHRIWRLPERVWVDEFGNSNLWIMLREEVDMSKKWAKSKKPKPARGFVKVYNTLNELPDCCQCLFWSRFEARRGACDLEEVQEAEECLMTLMDRMKKTEGSYVGALVKRAWNERRLLLGDVHYDNVGSRIHNLKEFGIKRHKKLVITDLGDWGQTVLTTDMYPKIKELPV